MEDDQAVKPPMSDEDREYYRRVAYYLLQHQLAMKQIENQLSKFMLSVFKAETPPDQVLIGLDKIGTALIEVGEAMTFGGEGSALAATLYKRDTGKPATDYHVGMWLSRIQDRERNKRRLAMRKARLDQH